MHEFPITDGIDNNLGQTNQINVFTQPARLLGLPSFADKFIPIKEANALYRRVRSAPEGFRLRTLLSEMKIDVEVHTADLQRIPAKGPFVAVGRAIFLRRCRDGLSPTVCPRRRA